MRKTSALLPLTLLLLTAFPAVAQEAPRVLFCMGQCFGVDDTGARIPVTKGSELAPGQRLETGPNSYAQIRIGLDTACGIGENARVRFDRRTLDRDVVILDQGRIRMVGGEAIGRPATRPVELRTAEGNFFLRSADIEVKALPKTAETLPAPMLVKLNVGEARLGDVPVTKDAVQGIVGGKILDRVIPIGDIALPTPRREPAPSGPGGVSGQPVKPPLLALPVVDLPVTEPKPITGPILVSPALVSPMVGGGAQGSLAVASTGKAVGGITPVYQPAIAPNLYSAAIVPLSTLVLAQPAITTSTGTTSLNDIAKTIQTNSIPVTTTPTSVTAPLTQTTVFQIAPTTTVSKPIGLSPQLLGR